MQFQLYVAKLADIQTWLTFSTKALPLTKTKITLAYFWNTQIIRKQIRCVTRG